MYYGIIYFHEHDILGVSLKKHSVTFKFVYFNMRHCALVYYYVDLISVDIKKNEFMILHDNT